VATIPTRTPLREGLFTWPSADPQLIASRCTACGEVAFPRQDSCPNCTGAATETIHLAGRGKLWTWTIQRFPPPKPPFAGDGETFLPFGVGYIELPEGIRIEARLTENDPEKLEIGMDMELVIEKFDTDGAGNERMSFAFRPVAERSGGPR
jgi:uncharacterized OB-fold protein